MWARVLSYVFHPIFIPTYFFGFLALTLPAMLEPISVALQPRFLLFLFLVTSGLPLLNVAVFRMFGTIRSFAMEDRKERIVPFVFISIIYGALTYIFVSRGMMNLNDNFLKFMVIIDMLVIVGTVLTFFFKVSLHSLSVWGLIGMLIPLNKIARISTIFYPTIALIVLAGFIMSARLKTGSHTLREVMWGAIAGLLTALVGMLTLF